MIVTVILYLALPGMVLSQEMLEIFEKNCKVCCRTDGQVQDHNMTYMYNLSCSCSNMPQGYEHCTVHVNSPSCELCLNYTMNYMYGALNCMAQLYDSSNNGEIVEKHTNNSCTAV